MNEYSTGNNDIGSISHGSAGLETIAETPFAQQDGFGHEPNDLPLRQAKQPAANMQAIDITQQFVLACEVLYHFYHSLFAAVFDSIPTSLATLTYFRTALDVGQLVKDDFFTLFESIGAIEIMDPKMDSGFLEPGETLEDDFDCLAPLLPKEIIGIMDQLLCHEMAWHTGYPLSQTLFSSIHIDRLLWPEPKTFEQAQFYRGTAEDVRRRDPLLEVLRAYCLALVKGCDYVMAKIVGRDFFEEEDFCTHTYNRVLFVKIPLDVFLRELDTAIEIIEDPGLELQENVRSAIRDRLEFRKALLAAVDVDCPLNSLSLQWPSVTKSIRNITTTHQLGRFVPSAFSTKIQRRLASTVPPRPVVELGLQDALEVLNRICADCTEATRFAELPLDPLEYQAFLWTFSARSPAPLPYSRAYLSTILFDPKVMNASVSLPIADLRTYVLPASPILDPSNWALSPPRSSLLPKSPRLQFAQLIDEFIDRAGQPYLDLWVALGQNRCRVRRMLTHVIAGWDMLQTDAESMDADIAAAYRELAASHNLIANPLSTWVYAKKLHMIEKIILLSFEQDIFLAEEYAGMYHFLSSMAQKRCNVLQICCELHKARLTQLTDAGQLLDVQEVEEAAVFVQSEYQQARAITEFSKALHGFYVILLYLQLLPQAKQPIGTPELQYQVRMKPFLALQPPEVPPFADFQAALLPYGPFSSPSAILASDLRTPSSALWTDVDIAIKNAKDALALVKRYGARAARAGGVEQAWTKDVQGVLASCVALSVAVAGVRAAVDLAGASAMPKVLDLKVEIPAPGVGKRYAEGWVVAKVSRP